MDLYHRNTTEELIADFAAENTSFALQFDDNCPMLAIGTREGKMNISLQI
jgi:hypothetical protein